MRIFTVLLTFLSFIGCKTLPSSCCDRESLNGKVKQITYYQESFRIVDIYNNEGAKVDAKIIDSLGEIKMHIVASYNKKHTRKEITRITEKDTSISYWNYTYDIKGNMVEDAFYSSGKLIRTDFNKYDSKKNLIENKSFKNSGELSEKTVNVYNNLNQLRSIQFFNGKDKLKSLINYNYYKNGLKEGSAHYYSNGNKEVQYENKYDAQKNLTSSKTQYFKEGKLTNTDSISSIYTYDKKNNIIQKETKFSDSDDILVSKFLIEYW